MLTISFSALPPEMTESTTERTNISIYINIGQFCSAISVIATPILFNLGIDLFRIATLIMGAVSAIIFLIVSYIIKERAKLHEVNASHNRSTLKKDFVQTFKNKSFVSFIIFNFCIGCSWALLTNYARIYGYLFGINNGELLISGLNYVAFALSIPILSYYSKKVEIKRIIISIALISLIGIFSLFLVDLIFNVPALYFIIIFFNGFCAGTGIFATPYLSDAIDIDELNTGRRRESMHTAINSLFYVPSTQIIAIVVGSILLSFNYNQLGNAFQQPPEALLGIKITLSLLPMAFATFILLSQVINPLQGEYYKEMKRTILKLHQEKESKKD
jgi:GPH family glycoside/pentoside/hexuronide:cation symporter